MSDQYPQDPQRPTYQAPYQTPQTTMSPEDERMWGALAHGGAVAAMVFSAGFLGFVASVAVYVIHKDRGPFVRAHAANSINVQIAMFIWLVVLGILTIPVAILTLGLGLVVMLPALAAAFVVAGVLHVIGAIKAYNGEWWSPPLTPRFVR